MAIIRDFLKEREKRELGSEVDYREKIRAHRLSVFLKTALITIVVIAVIVVLNNMWKSKVFSNYEVSSSSPISIVSGAHACALGGNLLIYSKDGASCVDQKGKAVWNRSYEMQSPIVSVNGNTVAIGDYNGRNIYVANKDGLLGTIKTNLPIRALSVSDTGEVATVLDDSDVIRIYVYDGNKDTSEPIVQAKATMNKSGYPLSIDLSPNGKLMMVSYFYVDSGSMKSSIAFYNFGEVGSNEIDNYVSGYDYTETIVPYVHFLDNGSAFGLSDDRIIFFTGTEKPSNNASALINEEIIAAYYNENYVGLVFRDQSEDSLYRLDVYNKTGAKLSSIPFDIEYTDIVFTKDQVAIYDQAECFIASVKGQEKFSGAFNKNVGLMLPTNSIYRYLLVTQDSMDMIELK